MRGLGRHSTALIATLLFACGARSGPSVQPSRPSLRATGPRPSWVQRSAFTGQREGRPRAYGVGRIEIEPGSFETCWDSRLLVRAAENRARAELSKMLGERSDTATTSAAFAEIQRSEADLGWFDGDRTIHVLVSTPLPIEQSAPGTDPAGGVRPEALVDALKEANRAALEAEGHCADPHKRASLKCCGGVDTFCSDPTRFDARTTSGTCSCGDGPPCLNDYRCEDRGGVQRCVCRGAQCPCDQAIRCDPGETCGDGRCY